MFSKCICKLKYQFSFSLYIRMNVDVIKLYILVYLSVRIIVLFCSILIKDIKKFSIKNIEYFFLVSPDQQCSTEDEDDEFQEVSEDENSAANILDQGERMHSMSNAGGSEGEGSEALHSDNLKSEMKMEAPQLIGGNQIKIYYFY